MRRFPSLAALTLAAAATAAAGAMVVACSAGDPADRVGQRAPSPSPVGASVAAAAPLDARGTIAQLEKIAGLDVGHGRTLSAQAGALRLPAAAKGSALSVALPARSGGAQRLEVGGAASATWLELTPDAGDVAGSVVDGAVVYRGALADTDLVLVAGDHHAEELRIARSASAPSSARWRVKTGPGARDLRVREGRVELVDAKGRVQLAASKMVTIDAAGVRRPVEVALRDVAGEPGARELVATWSTKDVAWPLVVDPLWDVLAEPNQPRSNHAAVLLPDGTLMIYGGTTTTTPPVLSTVEIYDTTKNTWSFGANPGVASQYPHLFVVGAAGAEKVLGILDPSQPGNPQQFSLYDAHATPAKWSAPADMKAAHVDGVFVLLNGGKVLAAGGGDSPGGFNSTSVAEVFDPVAGAWSAVDGMSEPRAAAAGVALKDGRALVLGGQNTVVGMGDVTFSLSSAETFDPAGAAGSQWKPAAPMATVRDSFTATVLPAYHVLIAGGSATVPDPLHFSATSVVGSTALYDPGTNTWAAGAPLNVARADHTATLLQNGMLVVIGGSTSGGATGRSELFAPPAGSDPTKVPWALTSVVGLPRLGHTATLDAIGAQILVVGGLPAGLSGAEVFHQYAKGTTCATALDCVTGQCVDGVCCDTPCAGPCRTCALTGSVGTCKDATTDTRGLCGDAACVSGCSAGACVFKDASTACGAGNCYGSTLTPPGHCEGTKGACLTGTPHVCAGNVTCADATSCKAKCASDADCAAGGCDLTTGVCAWAVDGGLSDAADAGTPVFDATPPKLSTSVKHCSKPSDCSTGFCVDGVCCDTACGDTCHSCALPSSPGHCALEPIGVDLRHECGPALSCVGTCGAEGKCAVAQKGTTCAPSRCVTASTGLGPAACSAEGAKCPTDDSIAFDCAPYVCDQAVGACLTTCASSSDCANGTVCDTTTNVCVVPAPPAPSNGGCSYGGGTPGGGGARYGAGMLAFLAISLFAARRRARVLGVIGVTSALGALAGCGSKRELADVDAGSVQPAQPAPSVAVTPVAPTLVAEVQARPRFAATLAARTAITRDGAAFRFGTRKAHTGRLEARLSADARTLTLADSAAPGAWIELVAQDRAALSAQVEDGAVVARGGARDVLLVGGDDRVEEIQIARSNDPRDASTLRYQLRRGPGVASVRVVGDRVEVLDRAGAVRLRSDAPYAVDARGTVRAMRAALDGDALTFTLDAAGLVAPIALDPGWSSGVSMLNPRTGHTATRLADGRVLVAGGTDSTATNPTLASCEIFDPSTGTWTKTGDLGTARTGHSAVLLDDGRVLVAGSGSDTTMSPFELFDAKSGTWLASGATSGNGSVGPTALLKIAGGNVLIVQSEYMLNLAYLYVPGTPDNVQPVTLDQPHRFAAAAQLPDGSAMVVGGVAGAVFAGTPYGSQVLDLTTPTSPTFNALPGFSPTRAGISAFSTASGLIVLGGTLGGDLPLPQLYDQKLGIWTTPTSLPASLHYGSTISLLALPTKSTGKRIMVSGGTTSDGTTTANVDVYDMTTGTWSASSPMDTPRAGHTVTQLADGSTVMVGGSTDGKTPLKTGEVFLSTGLGSACGANADCSSGFCTDGVCCAVASCGGGKRCTPDGLGCAAPASTSCTAASDCKSGFCANGVCCATKCDGVCEACNLSGSVGTCSSLGPTCLGEPADAAAPVTDAGPDGGPPTVREAFTRCAKGSDCGTGHCVEGICCDTECTDRCHSCVLSGSLGKCTVEPTGVDLRHECGPGRSCLGTCSQGACVGSGAGTQCDAPRCTGPSTGVGPATCDKAGGSCGTDKAVVFDCSPYVCEPAFGECRGTCTQSDECAQGFYCDTPTQTCLANPTGGGGSSGGCVLGGNGSGDDGRAAAGSFALVLGLAALGLVARRRR